MRGYKFEIFTAEIERDIREGVLKAGQKLPSVRMLKERYQMSMSTIQKGYEHLVLLGLVESIPQSGYFVSTRPALISTDRVSPLIVVHDPVFRNHLEATTVRRDQRHQSAFHVAAPGDVVMPQKLLLRTMQQVVREEGAGLLRYYPFDGDPELKAKIMERAALYRTPIRMEELIITDGALQALHIALASVCEAGDLVAIESPCVFSMLEVIRVLRLKVIEIPVDAQEGFDVDMLQRACDKNAIKAVIVTPNYHNPTGTILSHAQREALLAVADRYDMAIIENDVYGDLGFHGQRPLPLKALDKRGLVLSYSSYAKTVSPGIRLGWLAAGRFTERAEQIKFTLGSTVSPIYQEVMKRLLSGTSYDRHLRAFKMQLAKNAYQVTHILADSFPKGTSFVTPSGGFNGWVKLPKDTDMDLFYRQCEKWRVQFTPGYTFSFSTQYDSCFRIVFADRLSAQKIEAIRAVGQAMGA
ncbi:aminotransferase-like domain-containing protein [Sphingobacterium psychroaquaticum]|uniref:DNA-binding transcriptional regulator, MocR family, contains an aminotransferase domain n=1 Tax=Sphingobacterium psychroaquaticum TaxID=561061 RepID=A0A1X7ICP5_9SPHI|nr:PLP-dependent aminotransferase family protein [Sphingobacterium psychroaquaticum]SMG12388.1 DNA-binding transcriptional regulator, MocR family, contains an aminotransferase domain [Sphingobacterium psychroaquaticum]